MPNQSKRKFTKNRGAALVEYALLIASISLIALPAVRSLQHGIKKNFCDVIAEGNGTYDKTTGECSGTDLAGNPTTFF